MSFSIVAAIAANNVIGKNNKLPWHLPKDLEHFYQLIAGKPVVMGRKTYESIGRPIKNSENIVLSHNQAFKIKGGKVVHSIDEILNLFEKNIEVMIIGGETVYKQFLPLANKMYLTLIDQEFDGDTYFPKWKKSEWRIIDQSPKYSNLYSYSFLTLQRKPA
jgi:dihydrofolate reductase